MYRQYFGHVTAAVSHFTIYELLNGWKQGKVALTDKCFPSVVLEKNVTKSVVSDTGRFKTRDLITCKLPNPPLQVKGGIIVS